MKGKNKKKENPEVLQNELSQYEDPEKNLLGVFSILLAVAKRTNPEKYLVGYKKSHD